MLPIHAYIMLLLYRKKEREGERGEGHKKRGRDGKRKKDERKILQEIKKQNYRRNIEVIRFSRFLSDPGF